MVVKKTRQINIRLSVEEEKMLRKKAEIWGGSVSAFIIEASLKYNEVHGASRLQIMNDMAGKFTDFKSELAKIGTNINQIAHVLNIMNRQENVSLSRDMLMKIDQYNKIVKEMKVVEEKIFKQLLK